MYVIRAAEPADIDAWLATIEAQQRENGAGGVYFSPWSARDPGPPRTRDAAAGYVERLLRPVSASAWLRIWLASLRETGAVVGHADLAGGRFPAETHRATLGMGLVRAHHRHGVGAGLLEAAVAWARSDPGLGWIDLGVFSGNHPARTLYRKQGFTETGRTTDRFRVDGVSIDDVQMVLRV